MVELDEVTRRALLARDGPPAHARAQVLAGLCGRLGGGSSPDEARTDRLDGGELGPAPLDGGVSAGAQLAWAAKVSGATLGLAAAGLLTLKLGAGWVGGAGIPNEGEGATVISVEPSAAEALAPADASVRDDPGEGEGEGQGSAGIANPGSASPSRGSASAGQGEATTQPGDEPPNSSLAAELELVRAAKQLAARPEAALVELDRHRDRFEAGVLATEREALRVEMLCALGRQSDAARARAEFLTRFPDSPLRARVGQDCHASGTDPSTAGDGSR